LGDVESKRGPRHLPLLSDRDEVLHVPQSGHSKPSRLVSELRRDSGPHQCPPRHPISAVYITHRKDVFASSRQPT
jgi:hypothetical protein